ncbi:alpha/beta hydrolase [Actinopolymorpha sp. B9G3]|uniref:alpha/beta hydrolase n=1 Tax=Actinopolymorpha sp. B9G3 TaxID=3158970 RepID=UPI0032D8FE1A
MVTYGDVRKWRPKPLDDAERALKRRSDRLLGLSDEFSDMGTPARWIGDAARAAQETRKHITNRMEWLVAGVSATRTALAKAADAIGGLRSGVEEAETLAHKHGFAIGGDGAIADVAPPQNVPADQRDEVQRERERIWFELRDRVEQILRRASDIDNDLATVLHKVATGQIGDGGATNLAAAAAAGVKRGWLSTVEPPPGKGSPGDNAGWWDTLSADEKNWIIANRPDWIGNRDGIPFTARDQANRRTLAWEKQRLLAERNRLSQYARTQHARGGSATDVEARLRFLDEKLQSIKAIEGALAKPGERQLLLLDTSPERAEAAVANGNVDKADHVAVFTPGLTSNVGDSLGQYDGNMAQLKYRTEGELGRYGDGGSVATVSWIGYQAPQIGETIGDPNSVVTQGAAERGAAKLAPFLQGIDAARDSDAHVTAIGHSYGSTTTGLALRQNTGVDEAVFLGSPGVGTSNVDDLKVPDGHATYIEAKNDPVGDLGRFGKDPTHLPGMGQGSSAEANLPDGRHLSGVTGHTSYLEDGSTSQYNTSVIVGGMPERMVRGDNRGLGDHPELWGMRQ